MSARVLYRVRFILIHVYMRLLTVEQVHVQRHTVPSTELLLCEVQHPQRNDTPKKVRTILTLHHRMHQCEVDDAGCNRG